MPSAKAQTGAGRLPPIARQALVLGAGPNAAPPPGFPNDWMLLTVNGSQAIAKAWGAPRPDLTLFGTTVLGRHPSNRAAQAVLRGAGTDCLVMVSEGFHRFGDRLNLWRIGYRFGSLRWLSRAERRAILAAVLGEEASLKPSNGIVLAIIALSLGCPRVVMTGFSLSSAGHAYNDLNHPRNHVDADAAVLAEIVRRKLPVFTNDPRFAAETGLSLLQF